MTLCYSAMALHLVYMAGKQSKISDRIPDTNFAYIGIIFVHHLYTTIEVHSQVCISVMAFHAMLMIGQYSKTCFCDGNRMPKVDPSCHPGLCKSLCRVDKVYGVVRYPHTHIVLR